MWKQTLNNLCHLNDVQTTGHRSDVLEPGIYKYLKPRLFVLDTGANQVTNAVYVILGHKMYNMAEDKQKMVKINFIGQMEPTTWC